MAFIEYTYSIVNDTLNGEVNLTTLTDEIKADPLASVGFKALRLEAVQGLVNPPDPQDVFVGYDPALNGSGVTALDAVIAAHTGGADPLEDALLVDSDVDFLGNALSGVGTLNGVGFDAFVGDTTTHIGRTDNPHATDIGSLGTGTLAELNSKVTDATLDDSSDPRDPNAHASSHEDGGSDPISHDNLAGLTSGDPHTQYLNPARFDTEFSGKTTTDLTEGTNLYYTEGRVSANVSVSSNTTHIGRTDNPHATDLGNLGGGNLAELNSKITDATLDDSSDPRDPNAHASSHNAGAPDELLAQNLGSGAALAGNILETDGAGGYNLVPNSVVITDHGNLLGLGDDDHTQYLLENGTRALSGDLDLGSNDVTNVGLVDGVDVSAQATTTNNHIADTANPHATNLGNLGTGTLAELNSKVTDATLDNASDPRDPNSHASTHISGGSDPISHNDLDDLTTGDPHPQYTTEARSRAAAPVQPTTGAPSNAIGEDGDLAIEASSGDLYEKATGTWAVATNLVGPEGATGFGLGAYARTTSAGVLVEARGLTVTRTANGRYEYLFTQAAADTNYVVVGQPINTVTDTNIQIPTGNISTGGFRLEVGLGDNGGGSDVLVDTDHTVIVLGDGIQGPGGITSAYESWLNSGNVGTEADFIADLIGPPGPGLQAGGFTGEVLAKLSNTDFDSDWVTLTASDVGADPAGTAVAAVSAHEAALDPHPQYLNDTRFDTEFGTKDTGDLSEGTNLYYTEGRVSANTNVSANTAHRNATGNPHATTPADIGAIPSTEKAAVNGVATLDGTGKIPTAQIPASALPSFDVVADIPARDALVVQEGDEAFVTSNGLQYIYDGAVWFERPTSVGMVSNAGTSTDNALSRFDGATGQLIQNSSATLDDAGNLNLSGNLDLDTNNIVDVGTVNGTVFNTFVTDTNNHIADTANPHATDLGNLGTGTLAELNSKVTDATLDDASDPRDPNSHASTHEVGGSDVLVVQDLSSDAALVNQILETDGAGGFNLIATPVVISDHGLLTGLEDDDHLQYFLTDGARTLTGDLDVGGNAILNVGLVDGVDVSAQATTTNAHIADQANPHATDLGNLGTGTLAELNSKVTDATLDNASDPRDPNAHASTHIEGGSDPIDGDKLEIDFTPAAYVPDASVAQADNTSQLSAHLKGIDTALVYGSNLVFEESLPPSTTTVANTFVQKVRLTLTVTASNTGTYRLDWSYFWNLDSQANDYRGRVQENDTTTLMEQRQEPKDSAGGGGIGGTNQRFPAAGTVLRTLTPGTYNYDLDYTTSSGDEASIFEARLIMYRIQ